jgi:AAA+ ATPase superfamily predicted ATPase
MSEPTPDPAFVPISPNPFIVGNPVRGRSMFFGREAEFELVRNRFQHSARGGLLVFCGERRSGKTSILFQILDQRLGPAFIPVLIDMQSMAISSEADFLAKIVHEVLAALGPEGTWVAAPDFAAGANHTATFHKFIEHVMREHPDRKLILLFDEYELFENKIDSGTLGPDVLLMLSSLMEHQSVFVIFTGSQHLEQRRREYWKILGKSIWKQISYLERTDALRLIHEPVKGRAHYGDGTLDAIFRLTAGQPFYTQAVCQSLVDLLNERRTGRVTLEIIGEVADGLVNNPLPQMIFLWDSLEREQKLVLALLAEALPDERGGVGSAELLRLIRKREYPLELNQGKVATALEASFRSELLTKDDSRQPPVYAFRMDLWRLWIRRMHSLWQVLREEGIEIRPRRGLKIGSFRLGGVRLTAGLAAIGAIAWLVTALRAPPWSHDKGGGSVPQPTAAFTLDAVPADASIYLDGKLVAAGVFHDTLTLDRDHRFRVAAGGYADSTLAIRLAAGHPAHRKVALRPLLGDLRVETLPPAAEVTVDGLPRGRSPVLVRDLGVAGAHDVEAVMPGRARLSESHRVQTGRLTTVSLTLTTEKTDLVVTTDPPGASVSVDGASSVPAPHRFEDLTLGRHKFTARFEGFAATDTSVEVVSNTRQIHIALAMEPPGVLVIQGDRPGQIYVDGTLVAENVQNSRPQKLRRGTHQVRVVLVSGDVIDNSVMVRSRERAVFDYTQGTVTRSPE